MGTKFILSAGGGASKIQKFPERFLTKYQDGGYLNPGISAGHRPQSGCAHCQTCFKIGIIQIDKGVGYTLYDLSLTPSGGAIDNLHIIPFQVSQCDGGSINKYSGGFNFRGNDVLSASTFLNTTYSINGGANWVVLEETFSGGFLGLGTVTIIFVKKVSLDFRCGYQHAWITDADLVGIFGSSVFNDAATLLNGHGGIVTVAPPTAGFTFQPAGDTYLVETLIVTQPPSTIVAGVPFSVEMVTDNPASVAWNSAVTTPGIYYDVLLESDPEQNNTLGGTTSHYPIAPGTDLVLSGLTLNKACKSARLSVCGHFETTSGFGSDPWQVEDFSVFKNALRDRRVYTDPFDVVPAAASKVVITHHPASTLIANQPFSITVEIRDAFDNLRDADTSVVTLSAGSHLHGTLSVNAVGGIATFTGLTYDTPTNGVTITAASSGLTSATYSQVVHALMAWTTTPSSRGVNIPFDPIEARIIDFNNVLITSTTDQISLLMFIAGTGTDETVHLIGSIGPITPVGGLATFGSDYVDLAGHYDIYAISDGSTYPVIAVIATVVIS